MSTQRKVKVGVLGATGVLRYKLQSFRKLSWLMVFL